LAVEVVAAQEVAAAVVAVASVVLTDKEYAGQSSDVKCDTMRMKY
jgi:hypothetical protein